MLGTRKKVGIDNAMTVKSQDVDQWTQVKGMLADCRVMLQIIVMVWTKCFVHFEICSHAQFNIKHTRGNKREETEKFMESVKNGPTKTLHRQEALNNMFRIHHGRAVFEGKDVLTSEDDDRLQFTK
ncbi:hypothetical protein J6590_096763, partial [Homalodisca vitripennis]